MAAAPYAKIEAGMVTNTVMIDPNVDTLDPAFTWIPTANITCSDGSGVQIGCSYDGTTFSPPSS